MDVATLTTLFENAFNFYVTSESLGLAGTVVSFNNDTNIAVQISLNTGGIYNDNIIDMVNFVDDLLLIIETNGHTSFDLVFEFYFD